MNSITNPCIQPWWRGACFGSARALFFAEVSFCPGATRPDAAAGAIAAAARELRPSEIVGLYEAKREAAEVRSEVACPSQKYYYLLQLQVPYQGSALVHGCKAVAGPYMCRACSSAPGGGHGAKPVTEEPGRSCASCRHEAAA